jgi:hypothetical protein
MHGTATLHACVVQDTQRKAMRHMDRLRQRRPGRQ